eukprot:scaffold62604_cov68-Phaeocystis_antarctica.AAC.8
MTHVEAGAVVALAVGVLARWSTSDAHILDVHGWRGRPHVRPSEMVHGHESIRVGQNGALGGVGPPIYRDGPQILLEVLGR